MSINVLIYGSLIADPGQELKPFIAGTIEKVATPFPVECARSSDTRDGAPTPITVKSGGSPIQGSILVLVSTVGLDQARTLVWRRETRNEFTAKRSVRPTKPDPNHMLIETTTHFTDFDSVLFTKIGSSIEDPTPDRLAELAIRSAQRESGARGDDGISYLASGIARDIATPLLPA